MRKLDEELAKCREIVAGKPLLPSVVVPASFKRDFELVANHYGLRELGEYEEAKIAVRSNLQSAIVCYTALAKEIKETMK